VRLYVTVTGIIFALLVAAHLWRVAVESPALARQPDFLIITLLSAGLSVWALRLLRRG
jgi:hypothetical protein